MNNKNIPCLLAPAGSYECLLAAISGGADEVYFGGKTLNARYGAKNFDDGEFARAIEACRIFGVKSNITLNTLVYDKEFSNALDFVYNAAVLGADAFIVQDIGLACAIKENIPEIKLHASTQCACHNTDGAKMLHSLGFSRIVLARELSYGDILKITEKKDYETEIFIHGALCVCHSGQCLFSSAVGKRSGNRGMCAQPCRMEYIAESRAGKKDGFPLSMKDLSLCRHVPELLRSGVASLKIEGRMKSPEYVYTVTKIFKKLLEEKRNASATEEEELYRIFSRKGFTDAYFTGENCRKITSMYGVRSEKEKELTREYEKNLTVPEPRKSIAAFADFSIGKKASLSFEANGVRVNVLSENAIEKSISSPADKENIKEKLQKTGKTEFEIRDENIFINLENDCFVPVAIVNDLRRRAAEKLKNELCKKNEIQFIEKDFIVKRKNNERKNTSVRLYFKNADNVQPCIKKYKNIDSLVFPLSFFSNTKNLNLKEFEKVNFGVLFPRVMSNSESEKALEVLNYAKSAGAKFCEISNIGHIDVVKKSGLALYGGIGLNIYNSQSAAEYEKLGFVSLCFSPELNFSQIRDIEKNKNIKYCAYIAGRLPLMTLENCVLYANGLCSGGANGVCGTLCDKTGAVFPVASQKRLDGKSVCRNIIYNSVLFDNTKKEEQYFSGIDVACISGEPDGIPM